jgi:hypothetical protein
MRETATKTEAGDCVCRLVDGFRSAIAGMFSDDGPLSGNAARKMD